MKYRTIPNLSCVSLFVLSVHGHCAKGVAEYYLVNVAAHQMDCLDMKSVFVDHVCSAL